MMITLFENNFEAELLFRLALACICGFTVGAERSHHHKTAGVRTYLIVAVGACVYAMVSKYGFLDIVAGHEDQYVDVSRVASSIVTGVGFLGAGTIFTREDHVEGLSTAAGMWVMAAIGMASGVGMYVVAVTVSVSVLLILIIFQNERLPYTMPTDTARLEITMPDDMGAVKILEAMLYERNIDILTSHVKRHKDGTLSFSFYVAIPESLDVAETVSSLYRVTGAKSINL